MREQLKKGLQILNIDIHDEQINTLIRYLELMLKWNSKHNLTAITEPSEMITKHLLDSLSIAPFCTADRLLDVGTGAGLPGIPLAILFPEKRITLLDSKQKKTQFLHYAKQQLILPNIAIETARIEVYQPDPCFPLVLARAFAPTAKLLKLCEHVCCTGGEFLLMKSERLDEELATLPEDFTLTEKQTLAIPGLDAQRYMVKIKKR